MDLKKVKIIIAREFNTRVKKRSFILMTILTPLLFAALMVTPSLIMLMDTGSKGQKVVVLDKSGIVMPYLESTDKIIYLESETDDQEGIKNSLDEMGYYALLTVSDLDENNNVSLATYSTKQLNVDIKSSITSSAKRAVEAYKLQTYDIDNLDEILKDIKSDVKIKTFTLSETGDEQESISEIPMFISMVMALMIYMFVFMFGNMVMRGVIEEKATRIVEVIISSVKPVELMMGKIVGVACVALTQFAIWIVLTVAIVFGVMSFVGGDVTQSTIATEQIAGIAGVESQDLAVLADQAQVSQGGMDGIFSAFSQIKIGYLLINFLIYFILGYLLYAAIFAAIGSAVDNEADTQQLVLPITIPLILGLFIMMTTSRDPDTAISFWASIIPFTSPMVMVARLPYGVPFWELLLSIGLLAVTFIAFAYISAKIYRTGILMYGKKAEWKDLWKWLKFKN